MRLSRTLPGGLRFLLNLVLPIALLVVPTTAQAQNEAPMADLLRVYDASFYPDRLRDYNGATGALGSTYTALDAMNDVVVGVLPHPPSGGMLVATRRSTIARVTLMLVLPDNTIAWQWIDTGISTISGQNITMFYDAPNDTTYLAIYQTTTTVRVAKVTGLGATGFAVTLTTATRSGSWYPGPTVALLPGNSLVWVVTNNRIHLLNGSTGAQLAFLAEPDGYVMAGAAPTADGKLWVITQTSYASVRPYTYASPNIVPGTRYDIDAVTFLGGQNLASENTTLYWSATPWDSSTGWAVGAIETSTMTPLYQRVEGAYTNAGFLRLAVGETGLYIGAEHYAGTGVQSVYALDKTTGADLVGFGAIGTENASSAPYPAVLQQAGTSTSVGCGTLYTTFLDSPPSVVGLDMATGEETFRVTLPDGAFHLHWSFAQLDDGSILAWNFGRKSYSLGPFPIVFYHVLSDGTYTVHDPGISLRFTTVAGAYVRDGYAYVMINHDITSGAGTQRRLLKIDTSDFSVVQSGDFASTLTYAYFVAGAPGYGVMTESSPYRLRRVREDTLAPDLDLNVDTWLTANGYDGAWLGANTLVSDGNHIFANVSGITMAGVQVSVILKVDVVSWAVVDHVQVGLALTDAEAYGPPGMTVQDGIVTAAYSQGSYDRWHVYRYSTSDLTQTDFFSAPLPYVPGDMPYINPIGSALQVGDLMYVGVDGSANVPIGYVPVVDLAAKSVDFLGMGGSESDPWYGTWTPVAYSPCVQVVEVVPDVLPRRRFSPLPELPLGSRYFLGLTQESSGDFLTTDPIMELRIESRLQPLMTQGAIYLPVEAAGDVNAVWNLSWSRLSQYEVDQLEAASDAGLLTIDDPLNLSCTGYISNLTYTALPGRHPTYNENLYQANAEFEVTRVLWPTYLPRPQDGTYAAAHGFGVTESGRYAATTPSGITVSDGWFVAGSDYLQLPSVGFTPNFGSVFLAFQPDGWVPGAAGAGKRLLAGSAATAGVDSAGLTWQYYLQGSNLMLDSYQGGSPIASHGLDLSSMADLPATATYVAGLGYDYVRQRVSLGVVAWDSSGGRLLFDTQPLGAAVGTSRYIHNEVNLAGSATDPLAARVRPIEGRFHAPTSLSQGALVGLMTRYLDAYALR